LPSCAPCFDLIVYYITLFVQKPCLLQLFVVAYRRWILTKNKSFHFGGPL
jgi:hypothetical protein